MEYFPVYSTLIWNSPDLQRTTFMWCMVRLSEREKNLMSYAIYTVAATCGMYIIHDLLNLANDMYICISEQWHETSDQVLTL